MAATTAFAPVDEAGLGADTLGQMVLAAAGRHGGVALRYPQDSPSASISAAASISYAELGSIVREIARGLIALGIERGDRVAILSSTRAEWTLADCGALCAGAVVVPIYHTNSPEECAYVLHHSGARLVFCENVSQLEKIRAVRDRAPALEHVVVFDGDPADAISLARLRDHAGEIPKDAVEDRVAVVSSEDLATLVYTSGTTGPPKGCLLTHANLMFTARMYVECLELHPADVLYQFLPLAHVLARVAQMVVLDVGGQLCFSSGDPSRLVVELAEIEPTHFPAVPRVYEKLHSVITGMIEDGPRLRRIVFGWALAQGGNVRRLQRQGVQPGAPAMLRYRLADRLALRKVRHVFGRNLKVALVGAAPVGADLLEFFDACGVTVLEGYGLTESCAAATLNTPGQLRFGTVGRPLPGTEIQIAQDGEILIRGPHVYRGYYRDDAATREMLKDGWLHSGDLGAIADDGFVDRDGTQEGPDHHFQRQERHAGQHRERPARDALDLPGGRLRR